MTPPELRAARKSMRLTQGGLAEAIGMWSGAIGEMERGEKPIEKRTWLAILYVCSIQRP